MRRRGQFSIRRLCSGWPGTVRLVTLGLFLTFTGAFAAAADNHPPTPPVRVLSLAAPTSAPAAEADLCLACHHHCGCHQTAVVERAAELPPHQAQTAVFRHESWQTRSIVTECPRKPPRA